jgi:multicomponent Na+:H+ antiporter subunit F
MNPFDVSVGAVLALLSVGLVLVFVRLAKGPSLADRVVAFELLASLGIGLIAVYAIASRQPSFLDVAIILALVSFVGTIGFAFYLRRRIYR